MSYTTVTLHREEGVYQMDIGQNEQGEIVNEEKWKDFWHRMRIAIEKKYEGEIQNAEH